MKKRYLLLVLAVLIVAATYLLGPKPPEPVYTKTLPAIPELTELDNWVAKQEAKLPLRADNHARIVWHQQKVARTEYSVVYLHGFAASYRDGYPVNRQLADTLGANLYLARWNGHGLRAPHSLEGFSAEAAWADAQEALAIGQKLGKKVIILSTSTGGTLALKLAASYPEQVFGLINIAPNIEDDQPGAALLNTPWGSELAYLVALGRHREIKHEEPRAAQYWDTAYSAQALVDLQVLVGTTMQPETFAQVRCPVLTLYYYKNMLKQDQHVEIDRYPQTHAALGTPDSLIRLVALPTPGTHFMGSSIKSADTESVLREAVRFLQEVVGVRLK